MTKTEGKTASAAVKDILLSNPDGLREVIRTVMQEVLEAEMDEALGAAKAEMHASLPLRLSIPCRRARFYGPQLYAPSNYRKENLAGRDYASSHRFRSR